MGDDMTSQEEKLLEYVAIDVKKALSAVRKGDPTALSYVVNAKVNINRIISIMYE
jgi:hypothetical protein